MTPPTTLEDRVLKLQQNVRKLTDAMHADHRLIAMLFKYSQAQTKMTETQQKEIQACTDQIIQINKKLEIK